MITAEHSTTCINNILDEYNLSKEDFWNNPNIFKAIGVPFGFGLNQKNNE